MNNQQGVFGTKGDFITSPEISQLFGEMLGVWFLTQWKSIGSPSKVQIIELGPGRGTLMADLLRTLFKYQGMREIIARVDLVEASPQLKETQRLKLNVDQQGRVDKTEFHWCDTLDEVADVAPCFLVAHEFFDALPIHKFQLTQEGRWREVMIANETNPEAEHPFQYVLAPAETAASLNVNSPSRTTQRFHPSYFKEGDTIEVSPDAWRAAHLIADRINYTGGTSLIVDYGYDHVSANSLRAIRSHKFTNAFQDVGNADLSVDVDFGLLKDACSDLCDVYGPVNQGDFLRRVGITTRLKTLLQKYDSDKQVRKDLVEGVDRLIGEEPGMGTVYKMLAMQTKGKKTPLGFENVKIPDSCTL